MQPVGFIHKIPRDRHQIRGLFNNRCHHAFQVPPRQGFAQVNIRDLCNPVAVKCRGQARQSQGDRHKLKPAGFEQGYIACATDCCQPCPCRNQTSPAKKLAPGDPRPHCARHLSRFRVPCQRVRIH
jgi:hypothetical protein